MSKMECYTREELQNVESKFPEKGELCPKCKTRIPQFADLNDEDERRTRELIRNNKKLMAIKELQNATGCNERWAKIWVVHSGKPAVMYPGPPCPYCEKPLITSKAKQCIHCFMDWHDEDNPRCLKST